MFVQLEPIRGGSPALINPSLVPWEGPGPCTRVEGDRALLREGGQPPALSPLLGWVSDRSLEIWGPAPRLHGAHVCEQCVGRRGVGICKGPFGGMVRFDKSAPTCGGRRRTVGLRGAHRVPHLPPPRTPSGSLASRRRGGNAFLLPQVFGCMHIGLRSECGGSNVGHILQQVQGTPFTETPM